MQHFCVACGNPLSYPFQNYCTYCQEQISNAYSAEIKEFGMLRRLARWFHNCTLCSTPGHKHLISKAKSFEAMGKYYCSRSGYPGDPNDVKGVAN